MPKSDCEVSTQYDRKGDERDLSRGLKDHLEETKNQIKRLDQVLKNWVKNRRV